METSAEEKALQEKVKKIQRIKADLITGLISLAIGAAIFCLYFFLSGINLVNACNGAALSGAVLVSAGILILLTRLGAFDTFAYGFMQLGTSMFGKKPCKYNDLVQYKEARNNERKKKTNYYYVIIIAGALFLIALLVLEIIFHTKY